MTSTSIRDRVPNLSAAQQAYGLRATFPSAQLCVSAQRLEWTGVLTPTSFSRDYMVKLSYREGRRPRVTVVDPALRCDLDGAIPHLYRDGTICLHDSHQWKPTMLFIDTLVPWSSEWLYYYELWVATGTWYGDGNVPVELAPVDLPYD